jgi:hypothetical protein
MTIFGSFLYGSGVLYGPSVSLGTVAPATGPSTGGNAFVLTGEGLSLVAFDDDFTGAVLDPALWTDISSGTGAISTGATHLTLSTGTTAGSYSGVQSVPTMTSFQAEVSVNIPRITQYPATDVSFLTFSLYVDASNYANMTVNVGSTSGDITLQCVTVVGGTTTATYETDWTTGISSFRILRWNSDIYFIANGSIVYIAKSFTSTTARYRIYSYNNAATYNVSGVVVNYFESKPFVVFGNSPVFDTVVVSPTRVRGTVPPSIDDFNNEAGYAGLVDVHFISAFVVSMTDAYEYYFEKKLVLVNNQQDDLVLSIVDDSIVRTPEDVRRGL